MMCSCPDATTIPQSWQSESDLVYEPPPLVKLQVLSVWQGDMGVIVVGVVMVLFVLGCVAIIWLAFKGYKAVSEKNPGATAGIDNAIKAAGGLFDFLDAEARLVAEKSREELAKFDPFREQTASVGHSYPETFGRLMEMFSTLTRFGWSLQIADQDRGVFEAGWQHAESLPNMHGGTLHQAALTLSIAILSVDSATEVRWTYAKIGSTPFGHERNAAEIGNKAIRHVLELPQE